MHENDNHKHTKSWMQQDIMKLHEVLSKFHIWHVQNGVTVQTQQATQGIDIICPKQRHGILHTRKQQATRF